jgi:hypothetical protein
VLCAFDVLPARRAYRFMVSNWSIDPFHMPTEALSRFASIGDEVLEVACVGERRSETPSLHRLFRKR